MPVLVIAVVFFLIFLAMGVMGFTAVPSNTRDIFSVGTG
jgi:hypothetical protein